MDIGNEKLIGRKLREIRKERNITIPQLSERSGISIGYISMVERGRSNPTLGSLQRLCAALNITLMALVDDVGTATIVHAKDRKPMEKEIADSINCRYESLVNGKHRLSALISTHFSDKTDEVPPIKEWPVHASDEFGFILHGKELFMLGDRVEEVCEGDAILVPAGTPHYSKNPFEEDCVSLWVYDETD